MDEPLVVVIDDSRELLAVVGEILNDAGYRTAVADTADGIEMLVARERPDLLILDVRVPGRITGLPLLHALRDDPASAMLPILVATADVTFLHENAGALKSLGCETLEKPFDVDSFWWCVGSMLPRQAFGAPPVARDMHDAKRLLDS